MKNQLIFPMAFYVFYIWCLGAYLFNSRVKAVKADHSLGKFFKVYQGNPPPERVILIGRHFDNQFQVPMLFLLTCTLYPSLGIPSVTTVVLAWLFVVSRLLHSWVHLGRNKVLRRVFFYTLGWIVILVLWVDIFINGI